MVFVLSEIKTYVIIRVNACRDCGYSFRECNKQPTNQATWQCPTYQTCKADKLTGYILDHHSEALPSYAGLPKKQQEPEVSQREILGGLSQDEA